MNFRESNKKKLEKRYKKTSAYVSKKIKSISYKVIISCMIFGIVIIIASGLGATNGIIDDAPQIDNITIAPNQFLSTIYDNEGNEIQRLVQNSSNRIFVPIDKIPKHVSQAFIAIEDSRFYTHHGIDLKGIARAIVAALKSGGLSEGASTITQQLLKNAIFDGGDEPNLVMKITRKIQEQYLAIEVEKKISKDKILEGYLNTINLGYNSLGIEIASKRYFGKSVQDLTISEGAVLAGIPKNPSRLNPISGQKDNADRRAIILSYMLKDKYITQQQYDEAIKDDVYSRIQKNNTDSNFYDFSYFTDALTLQIIDDMMTKLKYSKREAINKLYSGGLKIYSTQDTRIQKIADNEINNNSMPTKGYTFTYRLSIVNEQGETKNLSDRNITALLRKEKKNNEYNILVYSEKDAWKIIDKYKASLGKFKLLGEKLILNPQPQISFSIIDTHNGEIKAIVGGRGEKNGALTYNRATSLYRQPGSTIKPILDYGPGLDMGIFTKHTTFLDEPYSYPGGQKINTVWGKYFGNVDLTKALSYSLNIPAVKALKSVGPKNALTYLKNMDFDRVLSEPDKNGNTDVHLASALGGFTYGATNLQMSSAYATLGNNGVYTKPRLYTKIVDANGDTLIDNSPIQKQIYSKYAAQTLTEALVKLPDIYVRGMYGYNFDDKTTQIAAKTGTTNKFMDSWFCGYSNYYAASIWVGYDNFDHSAPNEWQFIIWDRIMHKVHKGYEYRTIY